MKNKKLKKALSVFLSVLMLMSCWVWVAPTDAEAAGSYYVRVYMNIYDGANSDGYGNAYTVVTDPNSEYYGKPNNYSWKTNAGYYGNINMAGFTLFYDNDTKYVTYDLAADLVAATTTLGNNWTSMDDLTLENFANCENKIEKVYGFTVSTIPSSLFWINDENNAVNGETSFGFYKITVAKDDQSEEHILWEGLSGSESYMYNYYGTITPNGIITPWNDWPDAKSKTFYKEYTTSFSDIWFTEQIATSVVFDNGTTINYTIPKIDADDGSSYYTRSAKVYDQYGGEMNVTPTSYYVTDANGNVLNNDSIYYSGVKLYVKRELQKLYPATTSNTFYLVAEYNGIKGSIQFNLTNPTYTVDYTNRNGEVLGGYTVTKVYGEEVELAEELSFYSEKVINDDGTHTVYVFPSTVTVTGDMTVSPVGTTSAHSDSAEDTDHKCDVCGAENITDHNWVAGDIISSPDCNNDGSQAYNCSDCGATKTETITSEGHKYAMTDLGDGTHISKCSACGAEEPDAVAEAHTLNYKDNNNGTHTKTCSECNLNETVNHPYTHTELARPTLVNGEWEKGEYTYTCECGATKTEEAARADYSKLTEAIEALKGIKDNKNLSDEANTAINNAIAKGEGVAQDLVTAEQDQIDSLVKELNDIKADADEAIKNKELGVEKITEATSGVKIQFIDASGLGVIDSVQLGKDNGFKIRVANGNADSNITIKDVNGTSVNKKLVPGESADFDITMPTTAGIKEYTITYTIDGLKNADGTTVTATTKAYLYVKGEAYQPYHYLHEEAWQGQDMALDYYVEATYGDFTANNPTGAEKFNDNMLVNEVSLWRFDKYDFGTTCYDNSCNATTGTYKKSDAHLATYNYYVDTSIVKTWQDAGFRTRFVETAISNYDKVNLKYLRLAVNEKYLAGISGDDKTFTVAFVPSASGTAGNTSLKFSSTGDLTIKHVEEPDNNVLLFGSRKANGTNNTAYANFSGLIPIGANADGTAPAKFMFAPKLRMLGGGSADEGSYMTTHIWLTSYDKAELREAVANAEMTGFNSEYFNSEKYEAYETALKTAKEVLGKAETNQAEIDAATEALKTAIADLKNAENEAKFILTVIHEIHDGADRNSEEKITEYDYYLVNGDITPAQIDLTDMQINKKSDIANLTITEDTEHTYYYWYINYSGVEDAIKKAEEIINNADDYNPDFVTDVTNAKDDLEDSMASDNSPASQDEANTLLDALTGLTGHTCADADTDHKCDTCGTTLSTCADSDNDHNCDVCGNKLTDCADGNNDHNCDVCGDKLTDCADNDKDHDCDTCGATMGTHADTNNDHNCEYCNGKVTDCTDGDNDHDCDTCGKELSKCADSNNDHNCDTCGKELSKCADGNNDHKCDVCGATLSECADNDKNHNCDTCGDKLTDCTDTDTDHDCDTCGATMGTHEDVDPKDHNCDYCNGKISDCTDVETDNDHNCDTCGKELSECTDVETDNDHNCDICGKEDITDHNYVDPVLTRPTKNEDGTWNNGVYTSTCNCGATETTNIARAYYEEYDAVKVALEALLANDKLTQDAKDKITAALEANKIADDYIAIENEQKIVDNAATALNDVFVEINAGINDGSALKPDYTAWEKAEEAYDKLDKTNVKGEIVAEANSLKETIAKKQAVETLTQATATQKDINEATARLNEIIAGINDGSLKKPADFTAVNEDLATAKDKANKNDVVDGVKEDIKEIEEELEKLEGANADKQGEIDALEDQLEEIIAGINDGSLVKPDYTEYNAAVNAYDSLKDKMSADDKAAVEAIKAEIEKIPADGTKAQYQTQIDKAAADIAAINAKYGDCAEGNHSYESVITEPTCTTGGYTTHTCTVCGHSYKNAETPANGHTWNKATESFKADTSVYGKVGYYSYDCSVEECNGELKIYVEAADYSELNNLVEALEKIITDNPDLTEVAKKKIQDAIDKAEAIPDDLTKSATEEGVTTPDGQKTIDDLVAELKKVVTDTNAAITDGSALKPDYDAWEEAEGAYDDLDKTNVKADIVAEATALKAEIAGKQADETLTQKTATQERINDATARLNEIIAGINDGTLKKPADFTAVNEDLATAKDKADKNDVVDGVKEDIKEIEEKLEKLEGANADKQGEIDALEDQLEEIIKGINDGSLVKPDFDGYDASHDTYEELVKQYGDKIKDGVEKDVADLDIIVDGIREDETATKADDQDEVDNAKAALDAIIAGINDGSLRDPDYKDVEDKLAEVNKAEDLNKDTQDKIDAIEKELQAIKDKKDPEANAKDDQPKVDALEERLDEIIKDIADGTATAPDYTEWDVAEDTYDKLDKTNVKDEILTEVSGLKNTINTLKGDSTANAVEDQKTIDDATNRLNEIINGINDGSLLNPDDGECKHTSTEYVVDNSNGDKLSTHSLKCTACEEILSTGACTFTTNTVDSTCRAEGYTTYCCTLCGYGFMADFTEMTAHNYGDWATEKGSCVKVMTKTRYCLNKDCYAQETVEVYENGKPVYGTHTLVIVNGQAATCLKDGHSDYTRCIVCNEVTESEVIPAIGHVDSNNNGNCDVCSGLMNPIGHCSCMCHGDTFFEKLLFRLVNFFWKLFKINANCECGAKHW